MSIIIIFAISLVTLGLGNWQSQQQVNAQQNTTAANFELYTSPTLGFYIEHPSDWKGEEFDTKIVRFQPADAIISTPPFFNILIGNVSQYLDTDSLTLKNRTLQEEAKHLQDISSLSDTVQASSTE